MVCWKSVRGIGQTRIVPLLLEELETKESRFPNPQFMVTGKTTKGPNFQHLKWSLVTSLESLLRDNCNITAASDKRNDTSFANAGLHKYKILLVPFMNIPKTLLDHSQHPDNAVF
jgi:hypothetical protein